MTAPHSHREKAENYRGEILKMDRYRVIVCKDQMQWVLQRKTGGPDGNWRAVGYCLTRKALLSLWVASTGCIAPELVNLPEQIGVSHDR